MMRLGPSHRYYVYRAPTDMRKSVDPGLVRSEMHRDPQSGDVFVFIHRRRTLITVLTWDRNGFALFYKRLEWGTFTLPPDSAPT